MNKNGMSDHLAMASFLPLTTTTHPGTHISTPHLTIYRKEGLHNWVGFLKALVQLVQLYLAFFSLHE